MNHTVQSIVAAATVSLVSAVAGAETMTMTFNNVGPSRTIQLSYNAGRSFNQAGSGYVNDLAGRMNWTLAGGGSVTTFCTQLSEYINYGQTVTYTVTSVENVPDAPPAPMGALRASLIRGLYARNWSTVQNTSNADLCAAFQLAVWEITHENITANDASAIAQMNVFVGAIAANNANGTTLTVGNLANSLIASLADEFNGDAPGLVGLTHGSAQDQLLVVPVPMTAGLAAVGLLGAFAARRRMK